MKHTGDNTPTRRVVGIATDDVAGAPAGFDVAREHDRYLAHTGLAPDDP